MHNTYIHTGLRKMLHSASGKHAAEAACCLHTYIQYIYTYTHRHTYIHTYIHNTYIQACEKCFTAHRANMRRRLLVVCRTWPSALII